MTADGVTLVAWHVPAKGNKPTILYFHGSTSVTRVLKIGLLVNTTPLLQDILAASFRSARMSPTFFLRLLYRLRTARLGCLEPFMIPPTWRVL